MWSKKSIQELDKYYPPCGECMLCGFKDKRHRLWDVWLGMIKGGDSPELIAKAYRVEIEYIKLVIKIMPFHRNNYLIND